MQLILTLSITYDAATISENEARERLDMATKHLFSNGLITGEGTGIVDTWTYSVKRED